MIVENSKHGEIVEFLKQYCNRDNELIYNSLKLSEDKKKFVNGALTLGNFYESVYQLTNLCDKITASINCLSNRDRVVIDLQENTLYNYDYDHNIINVLVESLIRWRFGSPISECVDTSNVAFNMLHNLLNSLNLLNEATGPNYVKSGKSLNDIIFESVVSSGSIALRPVAFTTHSRKHKDVFKKNKDRWYLQFSI